MNGIYGAQGPTNIQGIPGPVGLPGPTGVQGPPGIVSPFSAYEVTAAILWTALKQGSLTVTGIKMYKSDEYLREALLHYYGDEPTFEAMLDKYDLREVIEIDLNDC